MYEVLDDGRVALDPTAEKDRIALSIYADLLREDGTDLKALHRVFNRTSDYKTHYLFRDFSDNPSFVGWLGGNPNVEVVKVVVKSGP